MPHTIKASVHFASQGCYICRNAQKMIQKKMERAQTAARPMVVLREGF
jgi:hypothetical protein